MPLDGGHPAGEWACGLVEAPARQLTEEALAQAAAERGAVEIGIRGALLSFVERANERVRPQRHVQAKAELHVELIVNTSMGGAEGVLLPPEMNSDWTLATPQNDGGFRK